MTKFSKILILGIIAILIIVVFIFWISRGGVLDVLNPAEREMKEQMNTSSQATEALRSVVDVASELSRWKASAQLNFEIVDTDGRSANFGIVKYDGVRGERIVEEHVVQFVEIVGASRGSAEVDLATNRVIAMHRSTPDGFEGEPIDEPEKIARQFVERVYPEFTAIESTLEYDPGSKTNPQGTNYFFRWNDKRFAVPSGLDMDIPPFIQVGITSSGIIFSYDNTIQLYHNLPKEALRALCSFVEIPRTDDSSLDPEKGMVTVWFTEYEPFQNRYLVLPYEPETDFEGCSESAKTYLRHLPNPYDKN